MLALPEIRPESVYRLTPQQEDLLRVPETLNIFNGGSRGSGKTRGAML